MLEHIDTEEKFESYLLSLPEPSPEQREFVMKSIRTALPQYGKLLAAKAAQFPHSPGGHPKSFSARKDREIREEIKQARGPNRKLKDIYKQLAKKYDVSETTIKRIWLDGKSDSAGASYPRETP